jgi:hypothetical protein
MSPDICDNLTGPKSVQFLYQNPELGPVIRRVDIFVVGCHCLSIFGKYPALRPCLNHSPSCRSSAFSNVAGHFNQFSQTLLVISTSLGFLEETFLYISLDDAHNRHTCMGNIELLGAVF